MKNLVKKVMAVITTAVMALSLFSISAFADEPVAPTQVDMEVSSGTTITYAVSSKDQQIKSNAFYIDSDGTYIIAFDGVHGGSVVSVIFENQRTGEKFDLSIPTYTSGMPSPLTTTRNFTQGYYKVTISTQSSSTITGSFTVYN